MYYPDGVQAHKLFNKKIVSETEWYYEAWFTSGEDYYLVEEVPEGYTVTYINVGDHMDVTDRCYNGGTIINTIVPRTGDSASPMVWLGMLALSLLGLTALKRERKHE